MFGILHIVPGEDNEQLTLPEWNRHAVLWEACSKIKFFKEFLCRKFLSTWRRNTKYSRFLKLKKQISKEIILAIPVYSEAIILISKLVNELAEIQFMPKDELKASLAQEFLDRSQNRNLTAKTNASSSAASLPSSRYNTQDIIDRVNTKRNKQPNLSKVSFSLEKFVADTFEVRQKSGTILKYFFM